MTRPDAPFDAPWQAQLFALTVALNEAGHFTWADWGAVFGPRVRNAGAEAYWDIWSDALVALLDAKAIAMASEVADLAEAWKTAARATPHGEPISLDAALR